jgi:hypothetical protein
MRHLGSAFWGAIGGVVVVVILGYSLGNTPDPDRNDLHAPQTGVFFSQFALRQFAAPAAFIGAVIAILLTPGKKE